MVTCNNTQKYPINTQKYPINTQKYPGEAHTGFIPLIRKNTPSKNTQAKPMRENG